MCLCLIFIIQETNHRKESFAYTIIANQFRTSITTCHARLRAQCIRVLARAVCLCVCHEMLKKHFLPIVFKNRHATICIIYI